MFSHVMVGSNDLERARLFYDHLFDQDAFQDANKRLIYRRSGAAFMVSKPIDGRPASCGNGGTIGFNLASPAEVDAWHNRGIEAGGTSIEDPPGDRKRAVGTLYVAYLRDPDGNKLCALYRYPE